MTTPYDVIREGLKWEERPPFKDFRLCYFNGDPRPVIEMQRRGGYWEWQVFHRGKHPDLEVAKGDAENQYCVTAADHSLVRQERNDERRECAWTNGEEDESGHYWNAGCGDGFWLEDGDPDENGMKFCPYCGGRIAQVLHKDSGEP